MRKERAFSTVRRQELLLASAFILVFSCRGAEALPCPKGSFAADRTSECKLCPPGQYQDKVTRRVTPCKICPAGTYNAFEGAIARDLCQPCSFGTFSDKVGASSISDCKPCPHGMVAGFGSTKCITACQPGSFVTEVANDGVASCSSCRTNSQFSPGGAAQRCIECPAGLRQNEKGDGCETCPPGTQLDRFGFRKRCQPCRGFLFQDGTMPRCQFCPSGLRGNKEAGSVRCVPCPLGTAVTNSRRFSGCTSCPPQMNQLKPRPTCVRDGTPCPSNHFEDKKGVCRTCRIGERFDQSKKKCTPCGEKETSDGELASKCKACPKGKVFNVLTRNCECRPGFGGGPAGPCTLCPKGSYSFRVDRSGSRECRPCPVGTFANQVGATNVNACTYCAADKVQPLEGQTSCSKCPDGLVPGRERYGRQSKEFEVCVSAQTNCPEGTERRGRRGQLYCNWPEGTCPDGTFESYERLFTDVPPTFDRFLISCDRCPAGFFVGRRFTRRLIAPSCEACRNFRQFSEGGDARACKFCPDGMLGRVGPDGKAECACFSPDRENFILSFFNSAILPGRGLMRGGQCRPCKPGTFGQVGETFCRPCRAGTFQDENGEQDCKPCPAGTFTSKGGSASCENCPDGFTSFALGETNCVKIGG